MHQDVTEEKQKPIKPITSIDEIGKIIKRREVAYASHYKILSIDKEIPFNEINTSQQKRLIKSVIDSPIYNTEFIYTFRQILIENCLDNSIVIDDLTIIDKLLLALALRINSIGSTMPLEIEADDGTPINITMDLVKILETALSTLKNIEDVTIEDDYYRIICGIPTIGNEYKVEKDLRPVMNNIEIDTPQELRETIGDAFVGEIIKYVKGVEIKTEDNLVPVNWNNFATGDRIKIIETFKSSFLKRILDYVNQIRQEIDKIELINFNWQGKPYSRRLTIDAGFFTIS